MLRIPAALAVLGLSALTLAACASSPAASGSTSCERNDSDASVLDFAQASGAFGKPAVTLKAPVYVDSPRTPTPAGTGRQITSDAQDVVFSIAIANGATGQSLVQAAPPVQPLSSWNSSYQGLVTAMMCATEGTRVVAAIPASELSAAGAQDLGVTDDQSIAVTIDITKVYLAAADGTPQYNDRRGMPSVAAPGGRPGVIVLTRPHRPNWPSRCRRRATVRRSASDTVACSTPA